MKKSPFQRALGSNFAAEETTQRIIDSRPKDWFDTWYIARLLNGAVYDMSLSREGRQQRCLASGFIKLGAMAAMAVNHPFFACDEDKLRVGLIQSRLVGGVMHPAVEQLRELRRQAAQIRVPDQLDLRNCVSGLPRAVQDTQEAWQAYDHRMPKEIAVPLRPTFEIMERIRSPIRDKGMRSLADAVQQSCFPPDGSRPRVTGAQPSFA